MNYQPPFHMDPVQSKHHIKQQRGFILTLIKDIIKYPIIRKDKYVCVVNLSISHYYFNSALQVVSLS